MDTPITASSHSQRWRVVLGQWSDSTSEAAGRLSGCPTVSPVSRCDQLLPRAVLSASPEPAAPQPAAKEPMPPSAREPASETKSNYC